MKQISRTQLKKAVIAAEAERISSLSVSRPDFGRSAKLASNARAAEKLGTRFLKAAGMDAAKLQAIAAGREAEQTRMIEKHKADALKRAARQQKTLRATLIAQSEALAQSVAGDFFPYPSFNLDTPFLIWSTPLLDIDSAAIPFGSSAKFRLATSQYQGVQKVGFYFYWANPFQDYAVINAATFMSANGHLRAHAPWTIGVNTSEVTATAQLGLSFGWPRPGTYQETEGVYLGGTGAFAQTFIGGDSNATTISAGVSLNRTMFAVPPREVVVFEVALLVDYKNDDGNIEVDFAKGSFNITCPVVVFSILNSPPQLRKKGRLDTC